MNYTKYSTREWKKITFFDFKQIGRNNRMKIHRLQVVRGGGGNHICDLRSSFV